MANVYGWQHMIQKFHAAFGIPTSVDSVPHIPSPERKKLRMALIREEYTELQDALDHDDIVKIADGIADEIVVLLGTAEEYGINMDHIFEIVHNSNMAKLGPDGKPLYRKDGKVLKPEGWKPPDIEKALIMQGWNRIY